MLVTHAMLHATAAYNVTGSAAADQQREGAIRGVQTAIQTVFWDFNQQYTFAAYSHTLLCVD
eukprot:6663-Heterococcus_DN1.PRE.4